MKILITGASGFIGQYLVKSLAQLSQCTLRFAVRNVSQQFTKSDITIIDNIGSDTDWTEALDSIDTVIHLAGCAHQRGASGATNQHLFDVINSEGTRNLAKQAAKQKVKRFIYISSTKVYGENIPDNIILDETSKVGIGCDAYGASKLAAEKHLIKIADNSPMEYVIIRPPLVYGPGVAANFRSLIKLSAIRIPLPFINIDNNRSIVAIDNLVDFIQCCIFHEGAKNQILLVSDNDDVSLPGLIRLIRFSLGRSPLLFSFPISILKLATLLVGKARDFSKLTNSVQLNIEKAKKQVDWSPVISVEDAITKTIKEYNKSL